MQLLNESGFVLLQAKQVKSLCLMRFSALWSSILLLLLSRFSRVRLCATPEMTAHQAPPSLGFSRQEHWSGLLSPKSSDLIPIYCKSILTVALDNTEKAMAPHSSTLAWKIPWMEEPGRLQSMGSLRVGYDWASSLSLFTFMHWRRKWQPTPVFLPGESQGQGSLVACHLQGRTESDTTEVT